MLTAYETKLKQFTNKFKNPTLALLLNTKNQFKDDKHYATVKECYEAFLERLDHNLLVKNNPPAFTSWKYVVYCKDESMYERVL